MSNSSLNCFSCTAASASHTDGFAADPAAGGAGTATDALPPA
jgi:hypothetical protein